MKSSGFYGQTVKRFFHLEQEPVSLITRSLRNAEIAVTETRDDAPVEGVSGEMGLQDANVVTLMLYDDPNCETWERGRRAIKADIRAGATYLYDMKNDVRFIINKPFHALHFYLPRAALNLFAEQSSAPRVGELPAQLGAGHDDPVIRHIGEALLQALRRPAEINQLFIDYAMLAFTTHAAQTYGGLRTIRALARGGLAPWQVKRACEQLDADLRGTVSLQQLAVEFGLSVGHFSRAFKISTGLPPHQWLLRQRVQAAKQLMTARDLSCPKLRSRPGSPIKATLPGVFGAGRRQPRGVAPRNAGREGQRKLIIRSAALRDA